MGNVNIVPDLIEDFDVNVARPTQLIGEGDDEMLRLRLRRYGKRGGPRVLLLHGANTSGDAFTLQDGLAHYLRDQGLDVWVLDWRGSVHVMSHLRERPLFDSMAAERAVYSMERVGEEDIASALDVIEYLTGDDAPCAILGFCVSAGALALGVAKGLFKPPKVSRIVLMTLGLFYQVPWDSRIKNQEYLLDRIGAYYPDLRAIDPLLPEEWPKELDDTFKRWPQSWFAPGNNKLFNRLTFMYGEPFSPPAVPDSLDLSKLFGPLHLGLYCQSVQWVRDGYPRELRSLAKSGDTMDAQRHFGGMHVTLIGGSENRLWHRDSIDLMYEWLRRLPENAGGPRCTKRVLSGYAHLDLFWGKNAPRDVYGYILEAVQA